MHQKKELVLTAGDGTPIYMNVFSSGETPKGVLVVCHGFGEHIKMYQEFLEYILKGGYDCAVYDQRGHGEMRHIPETDRKKRWGIISDYSIFLEDLDTVKKKLITLYPNVPLILYGHSMGGNIAANYLIKKGQEGFKCAVLETPWLRLFKPKAPPLVVLAKVLGKINYKWTTKSGIDLKAISRDEQRVQEIRNDKLYHDRISFRMFSGIDTAGKFAIQNAASLSIPVFLICAEMDRIVSPNAIKMFKEHAGDNVILKIYKEAYHSVHNDLQKEEYFEDVISFLDSSC